MTRITTIAALPIGSLLLAEQMGHITHCQFTHSTPTTPPSTPVLRRAVQQLEEYFAGLRYTFALPLAPEGTAFQQAVWTTLQRIPYGETWSYRRLAREIDNPKAARAVGTANAVNPICILIPCHRVILACGKPGSYAGGTALKSNLLKLEQKGLARAAA
jgi:methylated-DNA-[protein]-cysteine S-methyltransferase